MRGGMVMTVLQRVGGSMGVVIGLREGVRAEGGGGIWRGRESVVEVGVRGNVVVRRT